MGAMASQITSRTIVYSTVYLRCRSKKTSKLRVTGLCAGNSPVTGEFLVQKASSAENVSIWWRDHVPMTAFTGQSDHPRTGPCYRVYTRTPTLRPWWLHHYKLRQHISRLRVCCLWCVSVLRGTGLWGTLRLWFYHLLWTIRKWGSL